MEFSNLQEDEPTNSRTEEVHDQEEQERVSDVGTGRSYECMFCKRGFTTAQALGGHMNIHRKDRGNKSTKPNTSRKQDQGQYYSGPRFYQPIFANSCSLPQYFAAQDAQIHYRNNYFPSTSSARPIDHHHSNNYSGAPNPHRVISTSPSSREEMRMSLSLQFSRSFEEAEEEGYDLIDDSKKRNRGGSEEGELDLELRLGHYP